MGSDSITNASSISAPHTRDFSKKKRANRSAKLKQCKLDARREQWLSQVPVKNKPCKETAKIGRESFRKTPNKKDDLCEKLEVKQVVEGNDGLIHQESDGNESPSNSLNSSILGGTDLSTHFTGSSGGSSSSSSGSSRGFCFSGNCSEEEEEEDDDGCLDDWEAIADALAAEDKQENEKQELRPVARSDLSDDRSPVADLSVFVPAVEGNGKAWRTDDAFRPQSLPNLSKQHSFPTSDRYFGQEGIPWAFKKATTVPSSCPICVEDLDMTDSSFLPCTCGFRLCLFCHKRILEEDSRCPGCRKPYEQDSTKAKATAYEHGLTLRLARSFSMIAST